MGLCYSEGVIMDVKIIKNDEEMYAMINKINKFLADHADELDNLAPELQDELDLMSLVLREYESKRYHFSSPDPIDFIKFMMEQKRLKVKDIADCFGSANRAHEVLNRKRNLSLNMIKKLHHVFGCSADVLIGA